jgi:hypothetical protein
MHHTIAELGDSQQENEQGKSPVDPALRKEDNRINKKAYVNESRQYIKGQDTPMRKIKITNIETHKNGGRVQRYGPYTPQLVFSFTTREEGRPGLLNGEQPWP